MTGISPGHGIVGPTAPSGSQGGLLPGQPQSGETGMSLILKPPSYSLPGACTLPFANAWQAPLSFAESSDPMPKRRSEGGTC